MGTVTCPCGEVCEVQSRHSGMILVAICDECEREGYECNSQTHEWEWHTRRSLDRANAIATAHLPLDRDY